MWPVSFAAAQRKMRQYKKNHGSLRAEDEEDEDRDYELPRIGTYWETQGALQEWENRIPKEWSSPSKARYSRTLYRSQCLLARGSIQEMETLQIREKFNLEAKRKLNSRKSVQIGGAFTAADAIQKIKDKRKKEGE